MIHSWLICPHREYEACLQRGQRLIAISPIQAGTAQLAS